MARQGKVVRPRVSTSDVAASVAPTAPSRQIHRRSHGRLVGRYGETTHISPLVTAQRSAIRPRIKPSMGFPPPLISPNSSSSEFFSGSDQEHLDLQLPSGSESETEPALPAIRKALFSAAKRHLPDFVAPPDTPPSAFAASTRFGFLQEVSTLLATRTGALGSFSPRGRRLVHSGPGGLTGQSLC